MIEAFAERTSFLFAVSTFSSSDNTAGLPAEDWPCTRTLQEPRIKKTIHIFFTWIINHYWIAVPGNLPASGKIHRRVLLLRDRRLHADCWKEHKKHLQHGGSFL